MTEETRSGVAFSPEPAPPVDEPPLTGKRQLAARGAVINAGFIIAVGTVNVLRSVLVAGYVTAAEFGVWAIAFLAFGLLVMMKAVAVSDKFIQQDEPDQEVAFQKAFTLELIAGGVLASVMLLLAPVLALIYDQSEILAPAAALALMMIGTSLQAPIWIFYRRMDFLRQRLLFSVDPLVAFVATVALAVAGAGYWALVAGAVAGALTGGIVALAVCPYRLKLHFDRETARRYIGFSWPLVLAVLSGLGIAQLSVFFGNLELGLAGAGAIGLAATISAYTDKIDEVVTQTIYPAICRVADQTDLLFEAFVKSNRLALMWGVPFGVSLTLFAPDLVEFGIGDEWESTTFLLQTLGLTGAMGHIGFNWTAFYRASGRTKPIAAVTGVAFVVFCATAIPLLLAHGLDGFAIGVAVMTAAALIARWHYIRKLFPGIGVARFLVRAVVPTLPAVAAVLTLRLVDSGERSLALAVGELFLYTAVTAVATLLIERRLLREALGYLRRSRAAAGASSA